jgi:hypothetical protein
MLKMRRIHLTKSGKGRPSRRKKKTEERGEKLARKSGG